MGVLVTAKIKCGKRKNNKYNYILNEFLKIEKKMVESPKMPLVGKNPIVRPNVSNCLIKLQKP